uniref:MPN domain-containing protein n=1 Tax=Hemiselmis tepida TaxID=464990 RepID=A0A7S0WE14_9CRYP|mmetsp:Transcript_38427/g.98265  ORF Transcript_38427/g.98265 Transcript_38427/m.98265 type:complete len:346 (+) Transcript_38427:57-1094(+)
MAAGGASEAQKRFELENSVREVESDAIYSFDGDAQKKLRDQKPWTKDPTYFKKVKVSALALLKMAMHARSGGNLEVMGILQGKVEENTFIVMDAFALPVEGTETRVTALDEGYEYMVEYQTTCEASGRVEPVVGWYHSHPGYGCWLSGIDVSTQLVHQQHEDPYLAIVVDPVRTMAAGKVEIGAFRTYPPNYKPPDAAPSEYQTIPLEKIEDFGVHANQYYPLDVSFFKSSLDSHLLNLLWNKYWISTLSSSSLVSSREYTVKSVRDLAEKIDQADSQLSHSSRMGGYFVPQEKKGEESAVSKLNRDSTKIAIEQVQGLMTQIAKDALFNKGTKDRKGDKMVTDS